MTVFYTAIENIRDVNFLHGYDAGSALLRNMADLLENAFPGGIIARASGAHFAGIVPENGAEEIFNGLANQVKELSLYEALHFKVGLCPVNEAKTLSKKEDPAEILVSMVDFAASAIGYPGTSGKVVRCYDQSIRNQEEIRLHVLDERGQSRKNRWLCVYYQPLVDVRCGRYAGFEALSRWIDPTYGPLTPDKFVASL